MDDPEAYHYDGACLAKAEEMGHQNKKLGLEAACGLQDEFIFRVEGTGALDCATIVRTACDVLTTKLRNLAVELRSKRQEEGDVEDE